MGVKLVLYLLVLEAVEKAELMERAERVDLPLREVADCGRRFFVNSAKR